MNSNVLTQTIVTGSDPRGLPEFSAIREEINKASHPAQPDTGTGGILRRCGTAGGNGKPRLG